VPVQKDILVSNSNWLNVKRLNNLVGLSFFVLIITLGVVTYLRNPVSHIKSRPYHQPNGCVVRRYVTMDDISPACMDGNYLISHAKARTYDWNLGRSDLDYYRVGDDAYEIVCNQFNSGRCYVGLRQYNAFSR
jgi:hypothetical protein